jgi:tRNA(fMet)-specific endonuclease VapC
MSGFDFQLLHWRGFIMVCMDTSFLVELLRGKENALRELEKIEDANERITTTPISAAELFEGAYISRNSEIECQKVRELLKRIELLEFSVQACEKYGKLSKQLRSIGKKIGDLDTLIACVAMSCDEPILTSDASHFNLVPGLIVRSWVRH